MRKILLVATLFISIATIAFGQHALSESRQSSPELLVYKLTPKDVRDLYLKGKELEESMLHTLVSRCAERNAIPSLPRGNYITVMVAGNELVYNDHTVDNFYYSIIRDEKTVLFLSDTLGNVIDNAIVRRGLKRLRFNGTTQTYVTRHIGDEKIAEVDNSGVLHYIEFEKESRYYQRNNFFRKNWRKIKNTFNRVFVPERAPVRNKYDGFVVFSKPKYKPGETVRFKAYINNGGRPYNENAEISLVSYYPVRVDTVLTTLSPYRPGMYESQFVISDSLKLRLDNDYNIVLRTKGNRTNDIMGRFHYEEYELGKVTFDAESVGGAEYVKGDTVKFEFNAKDENGMPIYDGRVDITVRPSSYRERKYGSDNIFIPDETWSHSLEMTGKDPEKLVLPDSAFVDDAAMYYDVECVFFDTGNEKHSQKLSLYIDMRNRLIDFTVNKGTLTIRELAGGQSVATEALLTVYNKEVDIIHRDSVMLPHSMPLMWMADDYEVVTATSADDFWAEDIEDDIMGYRFFRENGNVRLVVDNPAGFPFWYTIRKGKSIADRGYTSELDRSYRDRGKNGYTMQLSYLLGEEARTIGGSLPYVEKNISMEVNMATTIYPGQTASVDVLVRDGRGKPVRNADITAYAVTSKFGLYSPNVTIFGKSLHGKPFENQLYDAYENGPYNAKAPMEWSLWKERMGLDSIEYYKFLYPETYYSYSEKVLGEVTQIAPYVVIDGDVQGVHILWIDEQPHYFHQAQQLNVYSFPITQGFHTLKFRTYDREITAENVYVEEGRKTIVSINGNNSIVVRGRYRDMNDKPLRITVNRDNKKNSGILSERDMTILKDHMITVDNTFGTAAFRNDNQPIDMPAMINAGGTYYYLNNTVSRQYDHRRRSYLTEPVLAGPLPYRNFSTGGKNIGTLYVDTAFVSHFEIEGGYRYSIWNNYLKQTSWGKTPILRDIKPFSPNVSFTRNALTASEIRKIFHNRLLNRAEQITGLLLPAHVDSPDDCRLRLEIGDFADKKTTTTPLIIRLSGTNEKDSVEYFYYGGTRDFGKLPEGNYKIDLIFRDTTGYCLSATLYRNGLNYLKADSIRPAPADSMGRRAFNLLMSRLSVSRQANPLYNYTLYAGQDSVVHVPAQAIGGFDRANYDGEVLTGTVRDKTGEPVVGAVITIEGTETGTITDINGKFVLPDAGSGSLLVSYIGFKPITTRLISGYDYKITLEEDSHELDEVVVVGYGTTAKRALTGSISTVTVNTDNSLGMMLDSVALAGKLAGVVAGIQVRGTSSVTNGDAPLIIVDGVPYEGALSDLNLDIASLNIMKDASGAAIYGSRAANGVIFIETKDGKLSDLPNAGSGFPEDWSSANTLRTNFHDDAFWYPRLSTGRDGSVTFQVTYPDDITSWNANFIAVGGRKQTDKARLNIRSFKPLNAQLSLPQFVLSGDSINVIGRLTNHLGDTVTVKRSIELQGHTSEEGISLTNSHIDNIPVTVNESDSIGITYSLTMENGYFDGERRIVPVYKPGILESHGEFAVLGDTAIRHIPTDPTLGEATVHAEVSFMQLFLDEIGKIDGYPYLCNEQTASKIKALLLKKRLCAMFGMDFKENNKIDNLIGRLERNKNGDNLWGWWNQDRTELWISKQIVEALLDAEADGYKVDFNKQAATDALVRELNRRLSSTGNARVDNRFVKHELLNVLELLKKLNAKIDYAQYGSLVSSLPDATLNDRLRSMGMALYTADSVRVDSLLSLASETMMGSMYWGEKKRSDIEPRYFMSPNINNTDNTLTAYRILKGAGGHEKELERIRNWFFEIRRGGRWQNTYESSRIMETIMPDMLKSERGFVDAALVINGKRFEKFPLTETFMAGDTINVRKEGTVPVFFTSYQQSWNRTPERATRGFSLETAFCIENKPVNILHAGESIDLKISIAVDSDAEYIMIEVPIPAGCSYASKGRENPWKETHREYHKEKAVIFCDRLSKGSHDFIIKLLPRYTGLYHLNPAKVELMYYPAFFGRENMGVYEIR